MIKSTLNWLDLISIEKKWQRATMDKDDCIASVVYSLLNIKSKVKHIYLKISLKFLEICSKHVFAWV